LVYRGAAADAFESFAATVPERKALFMQVMRYGFFLIIGVAAQACGDSSDGDGGGDDSDNGNGGGSSGSGGSAGKGGTGNGGSSSGTTGNGGTAGTAGTCMAGESNLFDAPECGELLSCIVEVSCRMAGAQQQACVDASKQALEETAACVPAGSEQESCDVLTMAYAQQPMFAECAN
jgi:hypothetical protein